MRVCSGPRTELACSYSSPAALGVIPSAGVGTCASSENGVLASLNCGVGRKEYELEAFDCRCHVGIGFDLKTEMRLWDLESQIKDEMLDTPH